MLIISNKMPKYLSQIDIILKKENSILLHSKNTTLTKNN